MKPHSFAPITFAACAVSVLSAQNWTLIDDFDDDLNGDNFDQWEIASSENIIGPLPGFETGDEAFLELKYFNPTDPSDAGLHLESGGYGEPDRLGKTFAITPIPIDLPDGADSTFYFRYYREGSSNEFYFGLTTLPRIPVDAPPEPITKRLEQPSDWNDYSFNFAIREDSLISVRDAVEYRANPHIQISDRTWYEIWIVCHNRPGALYGPEGDTFELWLRGGEFTQPTQVLVPPAEGESGSDKTWANWRNPSTDAFTYVMFASQTGHPDQPNAGDPHVIDDLYITEGVHLQRPEFWNGFIVETDGNTKWVETPIGTIQLPDGWPDVDHSWVYSFRLRNWIWANPEMLVDEQLGWIYIPKN